jgi:hypothetical protein
MSNVLSSNALIHNAFGHLLVMYPSHLEDETGTPGYIPSAERNHHLLLCNHTLL